MSQLIMLKKQLLSGYLIYGYSNLLELTRHLDKTMAKSGNGSHPKLPIASETIIDYQKPENANDFSLVRGQESAKRGC